MTQIKQTGEYGYWNKADNEHGLKPSKKMDMSCLFCPESYQFHHSVAHTGMYDDDYVLGQMYKCPGCGDFRLFEVAVDKEYYNEVMDRRFGQRLVIASWEENDELIEKLEALGYW